LVYIYISVGNTGPITKLAYSRGGMGLCYGTVITPQAESESWHRRL